MSNTYVKKFSKDSLQEILRKGEVSLEQESSFRIATVNPEYVFEARKNTSFSQALSKADVWICDGVGLQWWLFFRFGKKVPRITGADLAWEMIRLVWKKGGYVILLTSPKGLSSYEETKQVLHKAFPGLQVQGKNWRERGDEKDWIVEKGGGGSKEVYEPSLILCNFGIPEQEEILLYLQTQGIPGIMMGIGGSFDYWTGKQKRAPHWMRRVGLEWLWRFTRHPWRVKRFFQRMFR